MGLVVSSECGLARLKERYKEKGGEITEVLAVEVRRPNERFNMGVDYTLVHYKCVNNTTGEKLEMIAGIFDISDIRFLKYNHWLDMDCFSDEVLRVLEIR